jgi:hypothetical protein
MNKTITIDDIIYHQVPSFLEYYISKNALLIKKSKDGTIKSIKKSQNSKNNPMTNYEVVSFYVDNISTPKGKKVGVHQIMAEVFLPKIPGKEIVNHIDGNKQNNSITNLEWCTQQENIIHAWDTGLSNSSYCELEIYQYSLNGVYMDNYKSLAEATRITGIPSQNISKCANGLRPSAGSFIWSFNKLLNVPGVEKSRKSYVYIVSDEAQTRTFISASEICTTLGLKSFKHRFKSTDTIDFNGYKITRKEI